MPLAPRVDCCVVTLLGSLDGGAPPAQLLSGKVPAQTGALLAALARRPAEESGWQCVRNAQIIPQSAHAAEENLVSAAGEEPPAGGSWGFTDNT